MAHNTKADVDPDPVALQDESWRTTAVPLRDRLQPLLARLDAAAPTGLAADKAFYDGLEGDP